MGFAAPATTRVSLLDLSQSLTARIGEFIGRETCPPLRLDGRSPPGGLLDGKGVVDFDSVVYTLSKTDCKHALEKEIIETYTIPQPMAPDLSAQVTKFVNRLRY